MNQDLITACPSCASARLICMLGATWDVCLDCFKFWERLPAGEPFLVDGELLPFKAPCDNCAFRGKSGERTDSEYWESLMLTLSMGGQFFCHKGIPLTDNVVQLSKDLGRDRAFDYPKRTVAVNLSGLSTTVEIVDKDRMRLCRGFLNQFVPHSRRATSVDVS